MSNNDIKTLRRKLPPIHGQDVTKNNFFENNESEGVHDQQMVKGKLKSSLVEQELQLSQTFENENLRHKRKIKRNKEKLELESELEDIVEDIVEIKDKWKLQITNPKILTEIPSPQNNNIYVEKKDKFVLMDKEFKLNIEDLKTKKDLDEIKKNNSQTALKSHKNFLKVSLFLHGLLAGIGIFHIIITYILFYSGNFNFLDNYKYLSEPMQCSFTFLFIFCLISSMDRYDPTYYENSNTSLMSRILPGSFVVVIYFIGLVFSLSTAYADETITLYKINPATINSTVISLDNYLHDWQILNLIRGIFAILGWIFISLQPFYDHMSSIIDF